MGILHRANNSQLLIGFLNKIEDPVLGFFVFSSPKIRIANKNSLWDCRPLLVNFNIHCNKARQDKRKMILLNQTY